LLDRERGGRFYDERVFRKPLETDLLAGSGEGSRGPQVLDVDGELGAVGAVHLELIVDPDVRRHPKEPGDRVAVRRRIAVVRNDRDLLRSNADAHGRPEIADPIAFRVDDLAGLDPDRREPVGGLLEL